jgi:hypothetical protein
MDDLADLLIREGRRWVKGQRDRYRPTGVQLIGITREVFGRFFSLVTIDAVRMARVERIENPPF